MSMPLTRQLGAFVSNLRYEDLSARAIETVRLGVLDCAGVMVAGSDEDVTQHIESVLLPQERTGPASICFSGRCGPAFEAAWINGAAAHALDYDDAGGHFSAILVPALLAEAQAIGAAGRDIVKGYVAGYEVWTELRSRETDTHQNKGWHPAGVFGPVGAAAACAALRRLDEEATTRALAIGASQSAGIVANFGTMTKPFHAGRAAHAGILAARLAASGVSASPAAFEHKRGFLEAISPRGMIDRDTPPRLGRTWWIEERGLSMKKYPMCYSAHRVADAILEIVGETKLALADIDEVIVTMGKSQNNILANHRPHTALEAKFSAEFAIASGVIAGQIGMTEFSDSFVNRADVQGLMARVRIVINEEDDPTLKPFALYDQVEIRLADGGSITSRKIVRPKGHISNPLTVDDVLRKFLSCVRSKQLDIDAEALAERLLSIDSASADQLSNANLVRRRRIKEL